MEINLFESFNMHWKSINRRKTGNFVRKEIKRKIKSYLERNANRNTTNV